MSGRILVFDEVPTNRALLKSKLSTAHFDVVTLDAPDDLMEMVAQTAPDLVMLDVTSRSVCAYDLCRQIKLDPDMVHTPVIMLTDKDVTDQKVRGFEAGADDFVNKPLDTLTLIARVRSLMRVKLMIDEIRLRDDTSRMLGLHEFLESTSNTEPLEGAVLLSSFDPGEAHDWAGVLNTRPGLDVASACGEMKTIAMAQKIVPDVILLRHTLTCGAQGLDVLGSLLSQPYARQSAIIFVVDEGDEATAAAALDLGATDYIAAPFDTNELIVRVNSQLRRKKYADRLRSNVVDGLRMAVIDPLTGLYNRRYAYQHLQTISARAHDEEAPFAVLMMDLDRFKTVNDLYGHSTGDEVLREVSRRLQENLRGIDLIARIGGEEFFVAMPGTSADQAARVAERLREAVENTPVSSNTFCDDVSVTVSIGVAALETTSGIRVSLETVVEQADRALYLAKGDGRNVVKVYRKAA